MNELKLINQLPDSKDGIQKFAYSVIDEIMEGNSNPVEIEVRLKMLEETIKLIRKDPRIKMLLTEEVEKGNDTCLGAILKMKQRKTWYFTDDAECTQLTAKLKARQLMLKEMKGVDPDTGEIVAYQNHTEYLEIKLS